jgi:hypothetical protein
MEKRILSYLGNQEGILASPKGAVNATTLQDAYLELILKCNDSVVGKYLVKMA